MSPLRDASHTRLPRAQVDLDFVEEEKEVKVHRKKEQMDVFLAKRFLPQEQKKEFVDIPVEPLGRQRPPTPIKLVRSRVPAPRTPRARSESTRWSKESGRLLRRTPLSLSPWSRAGGCTGTLLPSILPACLWDGLLRFGGSEV